jgi:hypothetical protein
MKNIFLKSVYLLLIFLSPLTVLANEDDPGLPGDGDPGQVPITDHLWLLMIIGVALIFYYQRKKLTTK